MKSFGLANHPLWIALALALACSAHATPKKRVAVEWEAQPGALSYELKLSRKGRVVIARKSARPGWSGELPFGYFELRVRGVDRFGRPGEWAVGKSLAVLPPAPRPLSPADEASLPSFESTRSVRFRWDSSEVDGARTVLTLRRGGKIHRVAKSKLRELVVDLPPGEYSWELEHLIEAESGRAEWRSPGSPPVRLVVREPGIDAPRPKHPIGASVIPESRQVRFEWSPVEGAQKYRVYLAPKPDGRVPASSRRAARVVEVRDPRAILEIEDLGAYTWRVIAMRESPLALKSVASATEFELKSPEKSGTRWLRFGLGESLISASDGGQSFQPWVSWTPSWVHESGWRVGGEARLLSPTVRTEVDEHSIVLGLAATTGYPLDQLRKLVLEASAGLQRWDVGETFPQFGLGALYRPTRFLGDWVEGLSARMTRIQRSSGALHEFSLGLSIRLGSGGAP
jgi:hypothetical protein